MLTLVVESVRYSEDKKRQVQQEQLPPLSSTAGLCATMEIMSQIASRLE